MHPKDAMSHRAHLSTGTRWRVSQLLAEGAQLLAPFIFVFALIMLVRSDLSLGTSFQNIDLIGCKILCHCEFKRIFMHFNFFEKAVFIGEADKRAQLKDARCSL